MRIMFVMLRTMGDVLLGGTICRELKRDFPECEITFYVNEPYGDLVRNSPWVDQVKESRDWHPDMIFMDMASGLYDRVFAPYQVRAECNMWHQFDETRHRHLIDFYWMRMGRHRPITERECYVFPQEKDRAKAESVISFDVPRVAVHSTSGVATKDWPLFSELTEELRKAGIGVLQIGGRNDRIVKGAIDLRGRLSFMEIAAILSRCAAFVGLDSGLSYMADATMVPTIVIQGSTDPVTSGPISERVIHLFAKQTGYEDCQVVRCHGNCRHEVNCNTKITVPMVMEELESVFKKWSNIVPAGV